MGQIELVNTTTDGTTIRYKVRDNTGLRLFQKEEIDLFISFRSKEGIEINLKKVPQAILMLPISLYLLPITFFYNVELLIPEMDKILYYNLPKIYSAYSKIYGPFKTEWKGKLSVSRIVHNTPVTNTTYDKIVFFSGGVDACHAGINNSGKRTLLVSIPDIERDAKNEGALRNEKYSLIEKFSKIIDSDWVLISNNFNSSLYNYNEIEQFLRLDRGLCSAAFNFDGWGGIRYLANMCCVAPIAFSKGVTSLVMGSSFEQIEDKENLNFDGAHPLLTDSIAFSNIKFLEQDGAHVRRTRKTINVITWCKSRRVTTKFWACFSDSSTQCGYCTKCVRTQLNILCAAENPKEWGFEKFSEKEFSRYVKSFKYNEVNPCWMWDNIDTIDDCKIYPYCNELLHWLKKIGYKKYSKLANAKSVREVKISKFRRIYSIYRYPHYIKVIFSRILNNK